MQIPLVTRENYPDEFDSQMTEDYMSDTTDDELSDSELIQVLNNDTSLDTFTSVENCAIHGTKSSNKMEIKTEEDAVVFNLNGKRINIFSSEYQPMLKIKRLKLVTVNPVEDTDASETDRRSTSPEEFGLNAPDFYADENTMPQNLIRQAFLTGKRSRTTKLTKIKVKIADMVKKSVQLASNNHLLLEQNKVLMENGIFREDLQDLADFLHAQGNELMTKSHAMTELIPCNSNTDQFNEKNRCFPHSRPKRAKEYKHLCPQCGVYFSTEYLLQNHLTSHTNIVFQCNLCAKVLGSQSSLKCHLNWHKNGPYLCNICGLEFQLHSTLINHQRVHTRKYDRCATCKQKYYSRAAYLKHIKKCY